jgi:hypothetical protein
MHPALLISSSAAALAVSMSSLVPYGSGTTSTIDTDTIAATASGGTPPYTYSYARTSGSTSVSAINPTSASTAFRGTGMIGGDTFTAHFTLTVTDSLGAHIDSGDILVTIQRGTGGGGGQ